MLKSYPFAFLRVPTQSLSKIDSFQENLNSFFEEGLYLSSPTLWNEFKKKENLSKKEYDKLKISLYKYWIRNCMRCTPYGTFAGITSIETTSDLTKLEITNSKEHFRKLKLDMNLVFEMVDKLSSHPIIRKQIYFYSNNSLFQISNTYRYAEFVSNRNFREYELSSIKNNEILDIILESSKNGAKIETLCEIVLSLVDSTELEAIAFIDELIQSQLLLPGIEPTLTGGDPLVQIINSLSSMQNIPDLLEQLNNLNFHLQSSNKGIKDYQKIEKIIEQLPLGINRTPSNIVVDLFLNTTSTKVEKELISEITKQAGEVMEFSQPYKNSELKLFAENFRVKFDQEEIALSFALDPDLGLGYAGIYDESSGASDLINNLLVTNSSNYEPNSFDFNQEYILNKYIDYIDKKGTQIEITESEIKNFKIRNEHHKFSKNLFLLGSLMKKDGLLTPAHFIFDVTAFTGPSSVNLMGRFTNNNAIEALTRKALEQGDLQNEEVIFAEIVHMPQTDVGNILMRSVLRNYEIPYFGKSGTSKEYQIEISDLFVSVINNEVVLRSKKLNKRIIPCLSTAHNFTHRSLPIYKFLCDLQYQMMSYPNIWNWGYLRNRNKLPRVVYKNLILKKGEWKLFFKDFKNIPDDKKEYRIYFKSIVNQFELPQRVVYCEGDNKLLIDFNIQICLEILIHYLRKNKMVLLEECLMDNSNCIVFDSNNDPFVNELIIPLHIDNDLKTVHYSSLDSIPLVKGVRKFSPMTEWIYFKIYCGTKTAETLLQTVLSKFIIDGLNKKQFQKFYFIRYRDEFSHLRIRFFNSDLDRQKSLKDNFLELLKPYLENNLINKIIIDTYCREFERYGSDLIIETEDIFFNDSVCVTKILSTGHVSDSFNRRLYIVLRGIDIFLDDFKLDLSEKMELIHIMKSNFFKEFGSGPNLQKQLNERYRKNQKSIFSYMNKDFDKLNQMETIISIFTNRSISNIPIIESILLKCDLTENKRVFNLLSSYIHMFTNRLFVSQQRKYELVTYYFLDKYYNSLKAIMKNQNSIS
jgi:thiopeptide-type bacteriocin biosynthesis protein